MSNEQPVSIIQKTLNFLKWSVAALIASVLLMIIWLFVSTIDEKNQNKANWENNERLVKKDPQFQKIVAQERRDEKADSRRRLVQQILRENPYLTGEQAEQVLDARVQALQIRLEYQERSKLEQCKYGDTYFIPGTNLEGACP